MEPPEILPWPASAEPYPVWWTISQHYPDTHDCNLTQEGYPMVFLPSSKSGGPEGFVPIPSTGNLPCGEQLHRRYSHSVGFQFSLRFSYVLRREGFYGARSANPATNLLKKVTQLQEDVRRHSWALDMDGHWLNEFLCPLTGFLFNPGGCPYHTPSSPENLVGEMVYSWTTRP